MRSRQAQCNPQPSTSDSTDTGLLPSRGSHRLRVAIHTALMLGGSMLMMANVPAALAAYAENDPIVNPVSNATEIVLVVSQEQPWVFTDQGNAIYVGQTTTGTTLPDPDDRTRTLTIESSHTNDTSKLVDYVTVKDADGNERRIDLVQDQGNSNLPADPDVEPGRETELPAVPSGNTNLYRLSGTGGRGYTGSDGYGIHLWFFTIGVDPDDGGPGGTGPTLTVLPTQIKSPITSLSDALVVPIPGASAGTPSSYEIAVPGAWIVSRGGDGGPGGDSFTLGTDNPGGVGGRAGLGGTVSVTSAAVITTSGRLGHGILAQSIAGAGGPGGDGYLFNSGATGGTAAQGGPVTVHNDGTITTFGTGADGILAQSLGGGGGIGGSSYGIVGWSGGGARGGNGGAATVENDGTVTTMGLGAHAIVAQSIGGSGGDAGAAGGIVSVGGDGGAGGGGGTVSVTNKEKKIVTAGGDASFGILAQSIGGGGGNGGVAGGIVGIGGKGDSGGAGGLVTVTNQGEVRTTGEGSYTDPVSKRVTGYTGLGSHGIVAQSIGGGGGTGGTGAGIVGLGGSSSGTSNFGQTVTVNNESTGYVYTVGDGAYGILAQSIGGGGGAGATGGGIVGIGGNSAAGASGGQVRVTNAGTVETLGSDAKGIVAQSIGGGGGAAYGSGGLVSIGGQGGKGGGAMPVTVANAGIIRAGSAGTSGSDGILAQAIGGGGGAGGSTGGLVALGGKGEAGGLAGTVTVTNSGLIETAGDLARGVHAQSIGGGGGSGGASGGLVSLGGQGSVASHGNTVGITNAGRIVTDGRQSNAIEAQSIGGGGGSGGTSGGAILTIGGKGGGGGNADTVTIRDSGDLETRGDDSHAILAQSIGGGGGSGGNAVSASAFVGVGIGGTGAGGGDGKKVTVDFDDRSVDLLGVPTLFAPYIHTEGDRSKGVLAQSVGGGGGSGGFSVQGTVGYLGSVSVSIGGRGGKGGDGGDVDILGDANLLTEGLDADGIVAQSIGGGGGNGGFAVSFSGAAGDTVGIAVGVSVAGNAGSGGIGKTVTLDSGGNIRTRGDQSEGIVAQSVGGSGGNGGFSVAVTAAGGGTASAGVSVGVGGIGGAGGNAGTVDATWKGNVHTEGDDASAIVLQGVGGGGGNGGFNVSAAVSGAGSASGAVAVGVGGSGGLAGIGGKVTADVRGDLYTEGDRSGGLLAQSVGGRGGSGGFNVSGSITGSGGAAGAVSVGVGGAGGGGGNANIVNAGFVGNALTLGDDADALLMQSVGGGGGNGGFNVSGSIAAAAKGAVGVSVGVGGAGGDGGHGQQVTARSSGRLETVGARSSAFIAQSLGGGGGNGGFNVSGTIEASGGPGGAISVGVGGSGGGGGNADRVDAILLGSARTHGSDANAVMVQSVGGGGGSGGLNVSGSIGANKGMGGSLAVGVGGSGGSGGAGGEVHADMDATVATSGAGSTGVLLQSVGGGGGSGGINVSGGLSLSKDTGGALAVGVGGSGDVGGNAALVTGSLRGNVTTTGRDSKGVLVQSVGGGGGSGGLNVSGALGLSSDTGVAASVGVGGFGAGGGQGGDVVFNRSGRTTTQGAGSDGVVVQSVGGGGGAGGINVSGSLAISPKKDAVAVSLGLGGFGGGGGDASGVTVSVTGDVRATGIDSDTMLTEDGVTRRVRKDGSSGIVVQSVGGAGGTGGTNVSGSVALRGESNKSMTLSLGVGGFGGTGGDAGDVELTVDADLVQAAGDDRAAITAQSIGGGGGTGGVNVSGGVQLNGQITAGVGGFGGGGGLGQSVEATARTGIEAHGAGAVGMLVQSVGGGGGSGGFNLSGGLRPTGEGSASSLIFGMGGFGGAGNASGDVTATQRGQVYVEGEGAIGVLVQSIAGGGGTGGMNVSGNMASGKGYAAAIGVGGKGGTGADAGDVILDSDGRILVAGDLPSVAGGDVAAEERAALDFRERANGILVQSVGGGGGNGGMNLTGVLAPKGSPIAVGVGGTGSGGGDAGAVTVRRGLVTQSLLQTTGDGANALTAQSIGGGGGNAGANIVVEGRLEEGSEKDTRHQFQLLLGGGGGAPGHGAMVDVTHRGSILTDGRQSDGIFAQSVGGGGGNANVNLGFAYAQGAKGVSIAVGGAPGEGGSGGEVKVAHAGRIETGGDNSAAIFAQSVGGGGGNVDENSVTTFETSGSVEVEIGRRGGTGGTGGLVTVTSDGDLVTHGNRAVGLFAQSVGNGGGASGSWQIGIEFEGEGKKETKEKKEDAKDVAVELQVGLEGGEGGSAGAVAVTAAGTITTSGRDSHGIQAQSVGGGGGDGGSAGSKIASDSFAFSLGVGGTGGWGAEAGTVDVINGAAIATAGAGAHGVFAQSVGGGGGVAGSSGAGEFNLTGPSSKGTNTSINFSVGGTGGSGATGNAVTVNNAGSITTRGEKAYGINAQSTGGGGGTGGAIVDEVLARGTSVRSLTFNLGGQGGKGGDAGAVSVTNTGSIHTWGDESIGVRAQSLGGGGGDGGLIVNLRAVAIGTSSSSTMGIFNIGGDGGKGGKGAAVTVTNAAPERGTGGLIQTEGRAAHGIFAQSVGGGGGNGSSVLAANLTGGRGSTVFGINVGGDGGEADAAGDVTVDNSARVETFGAGAHGVFAQSTGGGGGNGGLTLAVDAIVGASNSSFTPLIALGGSGGEGGDAGDVLVTNTGSIVTHGAGAHGIYALSTGGGGGSAGVGLGLTSGALSTRMAGLLSTAFGGLGVAGVTGGEGGSAGQARIVQQGNVTALGRGARATLVESVNGGGGHVTLDFSSITSFDPAELIPSPFKTGDTASLADGMPTLASGTAADTPPGFRFHGGGRDVRGARAGDVGLEYSGDFAVTGDDGAGNSAQAVGGGGGTIDFNLGLVANPTGATLPFRLDGRLGGVAGVDNGGGSVTSRHDGSVVAIGDGTPGVFLQSVGGGGGRGSVTVAMAAGTAAGAEFGLGGTGGLREQGGRVEHVQSGAVGTDGAGSHAVVLQSVGGGGGLLGYRVTDGVEPASPDATKPVADRASVKLGESARTKPHDDADVKLQEGARPAQAGNAALARDAALSLGSSAGSGLDGDDVRLELGGGALTLGDDAVGLLVQSIGGGGGAATMTGVESLQVRLGGGDGASGDGGDIELDVADAIVTSGTRSHGMVVQSIGGGGGAVFTDAAQVDVTASAGNAGDGGTVQLRLQGDVITGGTDAHGIVVQSLGGGGGLVDGAFAGTAGGAGRGGAITLQLDGDVVAGGDGSTALHVQSLGRDGAGAVRVELAAGRTISGGASGVAAWIEGGASNTLSSAGTIRTAQGVAGTAIRAGDGDERIDNSGLVVGNLDLGTGDNAFVNAPGGAFHAGATVALGGAAGRLEQDGLFAPGSAGLALATRLDGSFLQSASGVSSFELDLGRNAADALLASGHVQLDGALQLSLLNVAAVKPGEQQVLLFSGAGDLVDDGMTFQAPSSVVIRYELVQPAAGSMALAYDVDFAVAGLAGNRRAVGGYLNAVQLAGGDARLGPTVETLASQSEVLPYADLLTQLGPEFYAEQQALTLDSARRFTQRLRDCGALPDASAGGEDCLWLRFDVEASGRDAEDGFPATYATNRRYTLGRQKALDADWTFGWGGAFEYQGAAGFDGDWRGETLTVQAGLDARRSLGATSLGAALALGNADQSIRRRLDVTGPALAQGHRDLNFVSGTFDAAYRFDLGPVQLVPRLDLGATWLAGDGLRERGAGAQDLSLASDDDLTAWVQPAVDLGYGRELAGGQRFRVFGRAGALHYLTDATTEVRAGFVAAPAGVPRMTVGSDLDDLHWLGEIGVEFSAGDRFSVSVSYATQRSDLRDSDIGSARIVVPLH